MPLPRQSRGPALTNPPTILTPRRAQDFFNAGAVNVYYGDPDYITYPPSKYIPQQVELNIKTARICGGPTHFNGFRGTGDAAAAAADMWAMKRAGLDLIYTMWDVADYNALKLGIFPVPVAIELLNEWYGFMQTPLSGTTPATTTWTTSTSYAVGDRVTKSGGSGVIYSCVRAHTSSAGNTPIDVAGDPNLSNGANFFNAQWVPLWCLESKIAYGWARDLIATVPGWSNVTLLGPGLYDSPSQAATAAAVGAFNAYCNFHEYRFPCDIYDAAGGYWDSLIRGSSPWSPYNRQDGANLELFAHRAGPNDGQHSVDEQSSGVVCVRGWLYGHWVTGFRWLAAYQLIDAPLGAAGKPPPDEWNGYCGFIDTPDGGRIKDNGHQVRRMFGFFRDDSPAATTFRPTPISISWSASPSNLAYGLWQKANGQYILAVWLRDQVVTSPNSGNAISGVPGTYTAGTRVRATPVAVNPSLGRSFSRVRRLIPELGDTIVDLGGTSGLIPIAATESAQLFELTP
jgi:hypothetical protein